jgi:cation diffusion facilitator CzcD-associated flavoprotein CzcO
MSDAKPVDALVVGAGLAGLYGLHLLRGLGFYSYSFDPDLEQEWTENYPTQPEIHRYIDHVADRHDLRRDITLRTRVTAATYDEDAQRWTVETDRDETIDTRFLIMATGCLSSPKAPEIPGLERFAGPIHHTSR